MSSKSENSKTKKALAIFMVLVMVCFGTMGFGYIAYLFYLSSLMN